MKNRKLLIVVSTEKLMARESANRINSNFISMDYKLRIIPRIKRLQKKFETKIIAMDPIAKGELEKVDISCKYYHITKEILDKSNYDAMKMVRDLTSKNPILKDLLSYKGINFWQILENITFWHFWEYMKVIDILEGEIGKEKPDAISVTNNFNMVSKVSIALADLNKVNIIPFRTSLIQNLFNISKFFFWFYYPLLFSPLIFISTLINKKFLRKAPSPRKDNKIVIFSDELRHLPQNVPWIKEFRTQNDDDVIVFGSDLSWRNKEKKWIKDYSDQKILFIPLDNFITLDKQIKIYKSTILMLRSLTRFKSRRVARQAPRYKGISILELLWDDLEVFFPKRFFEMIYFIELTERMLDIEKPKICIFMCDLFWWEKTLATSCKKKGIQTIMLQHGIKVKNPLLGPTVVDKMAVFGDFTKKLLIESGVESEKIVVTGRPMWDNLVLKYNQSRKDNICKKLKIDVKKEIIVFATGPAYEKEEKRWLLNCVFSAMKEFPEAQLINKLHPNESGQLNELVAKEVGIDAVITKKIDLFDLLGASNLLINVQSTVALEAMLIGKPVISLNFTSDRNQHSYFGSDATSEGIPYVKSGAAIGVYKAEEMAPAIKKALYDKEVRKRLQDNRNKFIDEHAHNRDGMASKRVASLMKKLIGKKVAGDDAFSE